MAKTKPKAKRAKEQELDSVYFLKLVMYLIVGAQWLRFTGTNGETTLALPIGLIVGMGFALYDHFRIDRKIEFAVLLVAMFVGFYSQVGIFISS